MDERIVIGLVAAMGALLLLAAGLLALGIHIGHRDQRRLYVGLRGFRVDGREYEVRPVQGARRCA